MDLEKLEKEISPIGDVFKKSSKEVSCAGWVSNTRELGKIKFLLLRDITGTVQVTAVKEKTDAKIFEMIDKISDLLFMLKEQ